MTSRYRYQVYRLQLASDRPLPALLPGDPDCAPDLTLHWLDHHSELPTDGMEWRKESSSILDRHQLVRLHRAAAPEGEYVRLCLLMSRERSDWVIEMVMSPQAREVWVRSSPEVAPGDVESMLLNVGLGCVLRLRGVECLHGNTVVIGNRAAIILGPKRAGKSTMSAALIRQGASLLADDIAALTHQGEVTLVEPGFPRLRLWPQSLEALSANYANLQPVFTECSKRYLPMRVDAATEAETSGDFCPRATPLGAIYVLGRRVACDTVPAIVPVPLQESVPALTANTYAGYMVAEAGRRQEFMALSRVARTVPIRRIQRPNDLSRLHDLCRLVLEDMEEHIDP